MSWLVDIILSSRIYVDHQLLEIYGSVESMGEEGGYYFGTSCSFPTATSYTFPAAMCHVTIISIGEDYMNVLGANLLQMSEEEESDLCNCQCFDSYASPCDY